MCKAVCFDNASSGELKIIAERRPCNLGTSMRPCAAASTESKRWKSCKASNEAICLVRTSKSFDNNGDDGTNPSGICKVIMEKYKSVCVRVIVVPSLWTALWTSGASEAPTTCCLYFLCVLPLMRARIRTYTHHTRTHTHTHAHAHAHTHTLYYLITVVTTTKINRIKMERLMKELLPSAYSESRTPLTDNPTSSHVIVGYVPVGVWLCWFSALVFLSCTISVCSSTRLALNLMFDKVSICFCRQQDNRKSPPQSPAKYVKTMVRVVVDDAICFLCVRISWKKPKHTEFAHRTVAVSVLANYCLQKKNVFLR